MGARPTDWHPLHRSDPVPGDTEEVLHAASAESTAGLGLRAAERTRSVGVGQPDLDAFALATFGLAPPHAPLRTRPEGP